MNILAESARTTVFAAHDLTKVYRVGDVDVHALRGVNVEMYAGEFVVIVGASGSGKSTLLNILDPLFVANEGTFVAAVAPHRINDALNALQRHIQIGSPTHIGNAQARQLSPVLIRRGLGPDQPLDEPMAAMLPRIC